jgi:PAS domain S-box-containing protein
MQQNDKLTSFLSEFIKSSENWASSIIDFEVKQEKQYYLMAAQKYQQGGAIVSVGIDITDRKQAEEALKQSEATNRALIEAIPDLLLRVRGDGVYLDDAVGAGRVKRFSGDNIALNTTTVYDSLPPAQAQQRMDAIKRALETKTLQMYEHQLLIDGQLIDEEVRVIVIGENEVLVMVRDITDRKRAEEALRIAEENYRSIFENALEGIFQSSLEGRYLNVNSAMARIYGYDSPQEMIETITDIGTQIYVDRLDQAEFKRQLEEHDQVNDFEYRVYQKDGSIIWIQEDTRAVRDHQGQLLYYEGMIQDITDRKNREDELRRQLEELKIEIDHKKREKEVAMLTGSSYFQEVQQEVAEVNLDEFWS